MEKEEEYYFSMPVTSDEHRPGTINAIFAAQSAVTPVVIIRNIPLYYSPPELCKFLSTLDENIQQILILTSSIFPSFVVLAKCDAIKHCEELVKQARENKISICSLDTLEYDYFHSALFQSEKLRHTLDTFLEEPHGEVKECPICLSDCSDLITTISCGHTFHNRCLIELSEWECPMCRCRPETSVSGQCCRVCSKTDQIYMCLICARSFCIDHAREHYGNTTHVYFVSADGKETWNIMTCYSMRRLAYGKNGELVEMCAKDENMQSYLEAAIDQQLHIHTDLASKKMEQQNDAFRARKAELVAAINAKKEKLKEMRESIEYHSEHLQKVEKLRQLRDLSLASAKSLIAKNKQLEIDIKRMQTDIAEEEELMKDLVTNIGVLTMANMAGSNQKLHVINK